MAFATVERSAASFRLHLDAAFHDFEQAHGKPNRVPFCWLRKQFLADYPGETFDQALVEAFAEGERYDIFPDPAATPEELAGAITYDGRPMIFLARVDDAYVDEWEDAQAATRGKRPAPQPPAPLVPLADCDDCPDAMAATAYRLSVLTRGALEVLAAPRRRLDGDPASLGHLYTATLPDAVVCLTLDDRLDLAEQIDFFLYRLASWCHAQAAQIRATTSSAGATD